MAQKDVRDGKRIGFFPAAYKAAWTQRFCFQPIYLCFLGEQYKSYRQDKGKQNKLPTGPPDFSPDAGVLWDDH